MIRTIPSTITRSNTRMSDSKKRRLRDRSSGAPTLISESCKINGVISAYFRPYFCLYRC